MDRICIGIAAYGPQSPRFWMPLATMCGQLQHSNIELVSIPISISMCTDQNRNHVARKFLKQTKADWIMWIDGDNVIPPGGIRRLLDAKKPLISGLYYLRGEPYEPVVYYRNERRRYWRLKEWNRGEIIPADSGGMGTTLVHRSVYEEMQKQFVLVERWNGSTYPVHKDDIIGKIPVVNPSMKNGPKLVNGIWKEPVVMPTADELKDAPFPWYMLEWGRTEDMIFYENAKRCGINLWIDTSVVCKHVGEWEIDGKTYHQFLDTKHEHMPRMTEHLDMEVADNEIQGS